MSTDQLSNLLIALASDENVQRRTLNDISSGLGDRTYGVLLLVLALINFIPSIPGFSGFVGVALIIVTSQLVVVGGRPGSRLSLAADEAPGISLPARFAKVLRPVRWFERVCKPRLEILTSIRIERLLSVLFLYLAAAIMSSILVIGEIPPAIAIAILAPQSRLGFDILHRPCSVMASIPQGCPGET